MSLRVQNSINSQVSKSNIRTNQSSPSAHVRVEGVLERERAPLEEGMQVAEASPIIPQNPDGMYAISIRTEAYNLQISHKAVALYNIAGPIRLARKNYADSQLL